MSKFQHIIPIIDTIHAAEVAVLEDDIERIDNQRAELEADNQQKDIEIADLKAKLAVHETPAPPVEPPPVVVVGQTRIDVSKLPNKWFELVSGKTYENVLWFGGGTGAQGVNAAVRPRSTEQNYARDITIKNCIVEYATCNLSLRFTESCKVIDTEIRFAGQCGFGAAKARKLLLQRVKLHHCNYGLESNPDVHWDEKEKKWVPNLGSDGKPRFVVVNGKYYAKEGFEAGGSKITGSTDVVIEDCQAYENRGKGLWFDVRGNDRIKVINFKAYKNTRVGNVSWGGVGVLCELAKGVTIEGGEFYDNESSAIAINESQGIIVRSATLSDNLALRNSANRRDWSGIRDITITGNTFKNAKIERLLWGGSPSDAALNIKITNNAGLN